MSVENGGPAFPQDNDATGSAGMTLRDYFAAKAMEGLIAGSMAARANDNTNYEYEEHVVARNAYLMANAMLAERAK